MINHSRYRLFLMISMILATLSVVMFIYQHFFYEDNRLKELSTVYLVASPIDAHDEISAGDLKEVKIPKQALLDGMITDLTTLTETPHYALHSLIQGEILVESQLTTENLNNEGTLLVPLTGNYLSDILPDDMVSIYILTPVPTEDNSQMQYAVAKLFSSKKVYANGRLHTVGEVIDGETTETYIKVTEEEMNAYYQALKTSEIIVAKHMVDMPAMIDDLGNFNIFDFEELTTPPTHSSENQTPNVNTNGNNSANNSVGNVQNNSQTNGNIGTINPPLANNNSTNTEEEISEDDRSTVLYRAGEGETWETIAIKFKTDKNTLYKLNPNVLTIKQGTELIVPSV